MNDIKKQIEEILERESARDHFAVAAGESIFSSTAEAISALFRELEGEKRNLKRQITHKDEVLREKNLTLDAIGYVWCSGGCKGGVFRFTDVQLTEAQVQMVELNTTRLRQWFESAENRKLPLELVSENPTTYRRISVDEILAQNISLSAERDELKAENEQLREALGFRILFSARNHICQNSNGGDFDAIDLIGELLTETFNPENL